MPDPKTPVVKSVGRVFEVLECFSRLRVPLTAVEIEKRLDYPASSTVAILKSMVALGYLSFDRMSRTYFPTIRLAMLSDWIDSAIVGNDRLGKLVEELRVETGETIILASQSDLSVQYLLSLPGPYPVKFNAPAGSLRPLCGSGAGWALLSAKPDAEVLAIVQRLNRVAPASRKVDADALLDLLREVRKLGYAASYGTVVPGSGILAMVLPTLGQERPLVIGVGGPVERLRKNEAPIVRAMRSAIKRHFGGRPSRGAGSRNSKPA